MTTRENLTTARLDGTARRLSVHEVPDEPALAELHAITRDPALLGQAAGAFMAAHRDDPRLNPFARRAADLLLAAGGDLAAAEAEAELVVQRMARSRPPGG